MQCHLADSDDVGGRGTCFRISAVVAGPLMTPETVEYGCTNPECGILLTFPAETVGATVQCGVCQHIFTLGST